MPLPTYSIDQSSVLVNLRPKGFDQAAHQSKTAPILNPPDIDNERKLKLLNYIHNHPNAIYADIAKNLLISERTVGNLMRELVTEGIVSREGSRKKGSWIILQK